MPNVSTTIETGCATPIAYATCTSQRSRQPRRDDVLRDVARRIRGRAIDLRRILARERAAAVRAAMPPYVSTMILRPVRPVSPIGPPTTNLPVGLTNTKSRRPSSASRRRGRSAGSGASTRSTMSGLISSSR